MGKSKKQGCYCYGDLMRLLVVEDEQKIVDALACLLKKNGYIVDTALDGETGLEMAVSGVYDTIVLDCMLPCRDGLSFVKELRRTGFDVPVIFLTARDAPKERVAGLDAGADDYLVKPFYSEELLARIRSLTRRKSKSYIGETISAGGLTLNPLGGQVTKGNEVIQLTVKESLLLEVLMHNFGQVMTKERIMEKVWGYNSETDLANVDLYIYYLRRKLNISNIKTVRGVGYFLQGEDDVR
ncbi:DNA-binding response OmpR family regulator [Anaerospora hongkongensis]|uniref:DNA-binding response OmpR family regulator n=2 Tax=Anaerospora hongkongensis TaxID=244830 RepID=A0A4R1PYH1_9FIRM|nr:DNA-binding response OmpR family regulator [Anaerospora hongkongensis]